MDQPQLFYSAAANGFFDSRVHATMPSDVVSVGASRHASLLAGQRAGRPIVPDANGRPTNAKPAGPTLAARRERAVQLVKTEARTRILAVASLERQANDNAAIATLALQLATGVGNADVEFVQQASIRRAGIDAIRTASNALEALVATLDARAIAALDIASPSHWPKEHYS